MKLINMLVNWLRPKPVPVQVKVQRYDGGARYASERLHATAETPFGKWW